MKVKKLLCCLLATVIMLTAVFANLGTAYAQQGADKTVSVSSDPYHSYIDMDNSGTVNKGDMIYIGTEGLYLWDPAADMNSTTADIKAVAANKVDVNSYLQSDSATPIFNDVSSIQNQINTYAEKLSSLCPDDYGINITGNRLSSQIVNGNSQQAWLFAFDWYSLHWHNSWGMLLTLLVSSSSKSAVENGYSPQAYCRPIVAIKANNVTKIVNAMHTVTIPNYENGQISINTNGNHNNVVVTAEPAPGYTLESLKYEYLDYEGKTVSENIDIATKEFTMPEADITIHAVFQKQEFTVTFDSKEGTAVEQQKVLYLETATVPAEPQKAGYLFDGWYTDENYNTLWDFNNDKVIGNTTLHAKWSVCSHSGGTFNYINKAICTVCGQPYGEATGVTATYGDTLADVALPAGWTWKDEATTKVGNVGANEFTVVFTPENTDNYTAQDTITVSVVQREIDIDWTNTSFIYDGTAKLPTATVKNVVTGDTITLDVDGAQKNASAAAYTATVTAITGTNADNYKLPENKTTQFTIGKATPDIGTVSVSGTVKDTTAPADVVLTYTGRTAGTFAITDNAMLANKPEYNWKFTPTDTTNYTTATGTVEITVLKTHTVTYKAEDNVVTTKAVDHGLKPDLTVEIPHKEGCDETAPYWAIDGEKVTEETVITQDTTITAVYTKNEPGVYENTTPTTNEGGAVLDNTMKHLKEAVLFTPEELVKIEQGEDVKLWLEVTDISDTVPSADKTLVEAKQDGRTLGMYLDIDMFKQIGTDNPEAVTQFNRLIKVSLVLDDSLINTNSKVSRAYSVIRVHNGTADYISCEFDAATKTLTFETDRLSTYAVVYKDTVIHTESSTPTPPTVSNAPNAGDRTNTTLWLALAVSSFTAVTVLIKKRKEVE